MPEILDIQQLAEAGKLTIAIIGGTGDLGSGLAKAWSRSGHRIVIGSRSPERAAELVQGLGNAQALSYAQAAAQGDVIVLAVPFGSHEQALDEIREGAEGKIVIDAVVPLVPPRVATVQLPAEGSAAQIAQRILGPESRVASAFHNVGASKLHLGERVDCDVLVFSDDKEARDVVIKLASQVASRGVDGGPLANSAAAEALTSVLIGLNRRYKVSAAGIHITGLDGDSTDRRDLKK
ncbi:NADPH-dependent F420 reductase [Pollutimonas sp. H1-120]|uniref:NADPH-dependent F420 reductase n=1 Tax=Pollutimonas sp. H1-120 TaxID=3148824 RepID=UPI003B52D7F6